MRRYIPFNIVFCLSVLIACVIESRADGPRAVESRTNETYTHNGSQFPFPPKIGNYHRVAITQYDHEALDVSVGYNLHSNEIAIIAMTVYIYPRIQRAPDDTLAGHFGTCKHEVSSHHPNAKLVSEGEVQAAPGGLKRKGQHATFTATEDLAGTQQPVRSELYLFSLGRWFIKYRVTYPIGQQAVAEPLIRAFIDELAWPKGP